MTEIFSSCVAVFKITQAELKQLKNVFRKHHLKFVKPCIRSTIQKEPEVLYLNCNTKFRILLAELVGYLKKWCNSIRTLHLKDCQPFHISQICYRELKKKCKMSSAIISQNQDPFPSLPDYSSLLVKVNAMLLCCVLACGGWILSTMPPCGWGKETEQPLLLVCT